MAVDEFSDYPDTGASGSQEYTSPEDPSIEFTSQNPRTDYEPPQPDVDYGVGATGSVSTSGRTNSGGGTGAPFIHPFKLEKFINPDDNSIKIRVYEGDVYAKIDTFELAIITITTGVSHTHGGGNYEIPEHQHAPRLNDSDEGLVMPNHTHGFSFSENTSGISGSTSCNSPNHTHSIGVSGTTGNVSNYTDNTSQGKASRRITGNTGNIVDSGSSSYKQVTGTSGTNSNSPVDHKFVAVTGQAQAPVSPVPTNFAGTFNKRIRFEDGTDTVFTYHESSHSSGDFYVKWVITISEAAAVQNIVGSIERVAVGAGAPADIPFGALTQNASTKALERTDLTGTFHQKIGSVTATTVDQVQFSNINWSMTVLPEVS